MMSGLRYSGRMNGFLEIWMGSSSSLLPKGARPGRQRNTVVMNPIISASEAHTTAVWSPLHLLAPAPSIPLAPRAMPIPPRNP